MNQTPEPQVEAASQAPGEQVPGLSETTWQGAEEPDLPRPTPLQYARGVIRVFGFVVVTLLLLPFFFVARALGRKWDRAVAALWCRCGLWLAGVKLKKIGEPIRNGGAVMANHASWLDIMAIGATAPVHFVAKSEIEGWPIFGWMGKISNTVFIARRRIEAKAQERKLSARARGGDLLCIFPEGTSSDGLRILKFKSALFSIFVPSLTDGGEEVPGIPAQPVALVYHAPPGMPESFHGWWGSMSLVDHVRSVVCLGKGGAVSVVYMHPLEPEGGADRKALAAATEHAVREAHRALLDGKTPRLDHGVERLRADLAEKRERKAGK